MIWEVTSINDDGVLKIDIFEKKGDKEPVYVHNMKPESVDPNKAKIEIQQHVDAIWEKIQNHKKNPEPSGSNLVGLSG